MDNYTKFKTALLIFAAATVLGLTAQANALVVYALTNANKIQVFDIDDPGTPYISSVPVAGIAVTGLQSGEALLAIDFRPASNQLYGLGSTSRLYVINVQLNPLAPPATAAATAVSTSPFSPPLSGTKFGMAFNPAVDRIRITSDAEQNIRLNPLTGGLAGTDTNLNPAGNVVEVAYDRNFAGTTGTSAFAIDSSSNSFLRIGGINGNPSVNGGVLTLIGPCGSDFTANAGLAFANGELFAIFNIGGQTGLYQLNPATGAIIGPVGSLNGNPSIIGMAIQPDSLQVTKATIKLDFDTNSNDTVSIAGTLDVGKHFLTAGQTATLFVGGGVFNFVLDPKGKGRINSNALSIKTKFSGLFPISAKFKASVKKANFITLLQDDGLVNADVEGVTVHIPIAVTVGNFTFMNRLDETLQYKARLDKSGIAK